ncbi:hypothetical protein AAMO2058_001250900 [Amorphochlora amoebiformis]
MESEREPESQRKTCLQTLKAPQPCKIGQTNPEKPNLFLWDSPRWADGVHRSLSAKMGLNASKNGEKKTQRRSDESRIILQNMLRAVKAGDLKGLKSFIGTYQDPPEFHINQADPTGRLLLEACNCGHIDIVRYLLGVKADANTFDFGGTSVLHRSCRRNSVEIARLLIDSKASVRSRTILGRQVYQPL